MTTGTRHPLYEEFVEQWENMRTFYEGERAVKKAGVKFLPATQGHKLDGMGPDDPGRADYEAYKTRAVYHGFVKLAVEMSIGLLHQRPPTIHLPAALEPLRERATVDGEGLEHVLRRINEEQLVTGRLGLHLDLPENETLEAVLPYLIMYSATEIINWDSGSDSNNVNSLNMVVLDESQFIRKDQFSWEWEERKLILVFGDIIANEDAEQGGNVYRAARLIGNQDTIDPGILVTPKYRNTPLDQIPFVFVNAKDIIPTPDDPPLMSLGELSVVIYRGEADYRQNLFMQGQDTLVIIGGTSRDDETRVGVGSKIDVDIGGDAKYIGVTSSGLAEQRQALENDLERASVMAGQFIAAKGDAESGEALKTRMAAQTATLNQIALAGAAGLENILRIAAKWVGANPDEVIVEPNVEFTKYEISGEEITKLMAARQMGMPLSLASLHALMVAQGITKLTLEEEIERMEEEGDTGMASGLGGGLAETAFMRALEEARRKADEDDDEDDGEDEDEGAEGE